MASEMKSTKERKRGRQEVLRRYSYPGASNLDLEQEFEILDNAMEEIGRNKETAFKFLVENGFLTKTGRLPKKYRS